jgi:hypothetical protein
VNFSVCLSGSNVFLDNTAVEQLLISSRTSGSKPTHVENSAISKSQTILEANRKISDMQGEQCGNGQNLVIMLWPTKVYIFCNRHPVRPLKVKQLTFLFSLGGCGFISCSGYWIT